MRHFLPTRRKQARLPGGRTAAGFSLVELLIVVLVMGILLAIAYPNYSDYVRRTRATAAVAELADWRARMEQYYQDHMRFGSGGLCGVAAGGGSGDYLFSCALAADEQAYVLTATSRAPREGEYTIDEANRRTTTAYRDALLAPARPCWLIRGGEC